MMEISADRPQNDRRANARATGIAKATLPNRELQCR
jgi:hypothetical protein